MVAEENNKTKNALKAGTWYVISSIIVKGIAVASTPIFTRLLTTSEYGMVATFLSWYALLSPICSCCLSFSVGRAKLDYASDLDGFVGSIQTLSLLLSLIVTTILLAGRNIIEKFFCLNSSVYDMLIIYLIVSPIIEFKQNRFRYRYQYKQNIAIALFLSITTVLLSLVLVITLPGNRANLRVAGVVIPSIILSLGLWIESFAKKNVKINKEYWKYGLTISAPLIFHTLSLNILSQSDRIFITKFCGDEQTGIYSLIYSYGLLITVITNAIADGWLPWFHDSYYNQRFDDIKKNVKWVVVFGCFIGLACVALAPEAIMILGGEEYSSGLLCVPPIVIGVVCQFIYTHYVNIELHLKKTKYVAIGTVMAALINIILNAIFVPMYGFVAAAYTTLASYVILLIGHYIITTRLLKIRLYNDRYRFLSIIITAGACHALQYTYKLSILRYSIIVLGIIVFVILYKDIIIQILKNRKKKTNE